MTMSNFDNQQQILNIAHSSEPGSAGAILPELSRTFRTKTHQPLGGIAKRIMDLFIALTALLLAAPLMIIIFVMLWLSDGKAVFSHRRVGYAGKSFKCYKFRSMVTNGEEVLKAHLEANPKAAVEWEQTRKLRDDPRVTSFGRMLRKSSIDELPQLFNIIRGEMSCVGPRPVVSDELAHYGDHVDDYLSTRPGLTGLWQVSGRSSTLYADRVALDSHYVRNWSARLDVIILLQTIVAVMRFDRAV